MNSALYNMKLPIQIIWAFSSILAISTFDEDFLQPFYVIGHMANSIYDIRRFLDQGANGVEADVTFDRDGVPSFTYHGFPCDCWRFCFWSVRFSDYLDYVRNIINPVDVQNDSVLALLYLDLKVSHLSVPALEKAGENLANDLAAHLFHQANPPWILLGVPDVSHVLLLDHFRQTFRRLGLQHFLYKIGYDVYISAQDTWTVLETLENSNITENIWLSSGITNCFSPDYSLLANLIEIRDAGRGPNGVYHWTIDAKHNIRRSLSFGVDGLMSNYPAIVRQVLAEKEFSRKYRPATPDDLPWCN